MGKILITGATGYLGTATVGHLLQKNSVDKIVAFARNENKTRGLIARGLEVRYGDFNDTTSLDKALQGIEKVLLISGVDQNRFQQHKNVVDAAKKAGAKYIAYTSVSLKDMSASPVKDFLESHFQTEEYIKESGLDYSLFRNTLYADTIPMFVGENVFDTGIYLPAGNGKVPYALRREMGEAIANALLQDLYKNKTYEITGSELYSYTDIAQALSELSRKSLTYIDADETTFIELLKQSGLPEQVIYITAGFMEDIKNQQYETLSNDLENLLGRKPATLKVALKEIYEREWRWKMV